MKFKYLIFLFIAYLFIPNLVKALDYGLAIFCDDAYPGKTTTCDLTVFAGDLGTFCPAVIGFECTPNDNIIKIQTPFQNTFNLSNGYTLKNCILPNGFSCSVSNNKVTITKDNGEYIDDDIDGKIDLELSQTAVKTDLKYSQENTGQIMVSFLSDENNLTSLWINSKTYYPTNNKFSITTNESSLDIIPYSSNRATVTGPRKVNLNPGTNIFTYEVTSESGKKKTYTLTITKLDDDVLLKKVTTTPSVSIDLTSGDYDYATTVNVDNIELSATPRSDKATVTYPYGKSITLQNGETKTIVVKVTAENGLTKNYNFSFTKPLSSNNYLSKLTIDGQTVSGFNKNLNYYYINVPNKTSSVTIEATAESNKSQISGTGKLYLNSGNNQATITVQAQNGESKYYYINIYREYSKEEKKYLSNNNNLKSLSSSEAKINFREDILSYTINVENPKTVTLNFETEDPTATASLFSDNVLKNNSITYTISVIAQNGDKKDYKVKAIGTQKSNDNSDNEDNISNKTVDNETVDNETIDNETVDNKTVENKTVKGIINKTNAEKPQKPNKAKQTILTICSITAAILAIVDATLIIKQLRKRKESK